MEIVRVNTSEPNKSAKTKLPLPPSVVLNRESHKEEADKLLAILGQIGSEVASMRHELKRKIDTRDSAKRAKQIWKKAEWLRKVVAALTRIEGRDASQ